MKHWKSLLAATCMAALLGFEAYGIEIETEIADFAVQLAKDQNIPVEILCTSYLPEGYEECEGIGGKDLLPPEATTSGGVPIDITPIYDGLDPDEVDLFFVYPWPGQEGLMMDLFKAVASEDAILLIAECLTEPLLIDLLILATELKLSTLVEVHDLESLIQVRHHIGFPKAKYTLLGINNRNLKTMTTDLAHTTDVLHEVPDKSILVSESGIRTHDDIQRLAKHGVHRVLVGEHLMRQPDVGAALHDLIHGA